MKILSPRQLRERLDERFRVLTGGSRDALARQQTLRAMIDWSYDLLDERERTLFRRLGIFVNGFALEGAAAVGSGEDLDELDVFDVLASLVDKSLVLAEADGDSLRYRLLESTRAYALEKLSDAGERDAIASRHLAYLRDRFVALWEQMDRTGRMGDLTRALVTDLDDVRMALDGALQRGEIFAGGALLAAASSAILRRGLEDEAVPRFEAFLSALGQDQPRLRARLCGSLSVALGTLGRMKTSAEVAAHALDIGRTSGDGPTLADALDAYALSLIRQGRFDDAEAALTECEAIPDGSARLRLNLNSRRGYLQMRRGDYESAATHFERLRTEHRALANTEDAVSSSLNLAEAEHGRGRTDRAVAIAREILPSVHGATATNLNTNLTGYLVSIGDLAGTMEAGRATVAVSEGDPGSPYVAMALEHVALAHALGGDLARAATVEGYAAAALARLGIVREASEMATFERLTALLQHGLAPEELDRLTAAGAVLEPGGAITVGLEGRQNCDDC